MHGTAINLHRRRSRVVLSLTPLIDVVFILLVFFMLVSQFTQWREIEMLPKAALGEQTTDDAYLVVTVDKSGRFIAQDQQWSSAVGASAAIKALLSQDQAVSVRALEGAKIQPVVSIVEALQSAGIQNVHVDRHGADR